MTPVRLIKNEFYEEVKKAYSENVSTDKLNEILGRGRAKKGMFEGDLIKGELEIGQVSSLIQEIKPAAKIIEEILLEFQQSVEDLKNEKFQF